MTKGRGNGMMKTDETGRTDERRESRWEGGELMAELINQIYWNKFTRTFSPFPFLHYQLWHCLV